LTWERGCDPTLTVEESEPRLQLVEHEKRITRATPAYETITTELAGTLANPSNGQAVAPTSIEVLHLASADIDDDNASLRIKKRLRRQEEEVRLLTRSDIDQRLLGDELDRRARMCDRVCDSYSSAVPQRWELCVQYTGRQQGSGSDQGMYR
jgi:hypothetical protein